MASFDTANTIFDNLVAGLFPTIVESETLLSGENVVRGALLGRVTVGGKLKFSLSAASDGSQVPVYIAFNATDATTGDKPIVVYKTGEFNQDALTYGTGHTAASVKFGLESRSIYLRPVQPSA
jgi:hypothetical protein